MKKFFVFLPILVTSFFLLLPNVRADTYNYAIPSSDFNYVSSSNFSLVKDAVNSFIQSSDYFNYYNIYYNYSNSYDTNYILIYFYTVVPNIVISNNSTYLRIKFTDPNQTKVYRYYYDFNTSSLVKSSGYSTNPDIYLLKNNNSNTLSFLGLLDTNFSITYNLSDIFNISSDCGNFTISNNSIIPTLYSIYSNNIPPTPPTPPDNTPILTNFINISIEKLTIICDFFTSSYVYLSIFVIFIIYFVILLFRRFR